MSNCAHLPSHRIIIVLRPGRKGKGTEPTIIYSITTTAIHLGLHIPSPCDMLCCFISLALSSFTHVIVSDWIVVGSG